MDRIKKTVKALNDNGMPCTFVESKEDVIPLIKTILKPGDTVSHGGSETLKECGVRELLTSGEYNYLDRSAPGITPDEITEIYRKSFFADVYLSSANAITENGELYNVDGNSNRVAAIAYGPSKVIIVAGINKIVPDLDAAIKRVKTIAAPKNTKRLGCKTYCEAKGECAGIAGDMCYGCKSDARICCNYLISAKQRVSGRINVILVGEELGY